MLVREVVNDMAFARGFGTLEKDRYEDPWWENTSDREEEEDPIHEPINQQRGRDNRRTRIGSV